ncbi:MAG: hypothetical protein F6K31_34365 [Symploca sp. SIO2G7]|nr:hypothetical protein [Symploca sp. SIO2G7]
MKETRRRGDAVTWRHGDAGTRGRTREGFSCMVVKNFFHQDCHLLPIGDFFKGSRILSTPIYGV